MEELKKSSPPYLSELRLESSWAAIGFSDPCPCCGSKKRRSHQPLTGSRKKLLVFDTPSPPQLTPPDTAPIFPSAIGRSPPGSHSPGSTERIAPLSVSKLAGSHSLRSTEPIAPLSVPKLAMNGEQRLERSGSSGAEENTVSSSLVEERKKEREEESVTEVQGCDEICVSMRCHCGTAREIILRR